MSFAVRVAKLSLGRPAESMPPFVYGMALAVSSVGLLSNKKNLPSLFLADRVRTRLS